MNRLQKLEQMKSHPMLGNLFKKLTVAEIDFVQKWVHEHNVDDPAKYAQAVMMWGIDDPVVRTKNYNDMWAIFLQLK